MNGTRRRGAATLYPVLATMAVSIVLLAGMMDRTLDGHRMVVQSEHRAQARAAAEGAAAVLLSSGAIIDSLAIGNARVAPTTIAESTELAVDILARDGRILRTERFAVRCERTAGGWRLLRLESLR